MLAKIKERQLLLILERNCCELIKRNSQIIWYSWNRKFNLLKVLQCINFVAHKYHGNYPRKPVEMRVFHQGTIPFQEESDFFLRNTLN